MTIHLNPEQERVIGQAIDAGVIREPGDIVNLGLQAIQRMLDVRQSSAGQVDPGQWTAEFSAWVHSHPTSTPLLSDEAVSRDSIYGMRGM